MARTEPFDRLTEQYEAWFAENPFAYESEVAAIRDLMGQPGEAVEIGVGTGRFASRLGIRYGIEPSEAMRARAIERGVVVKPGTAEAIPEYDATFDLVLMVTTICFLDDPPTAFAEIRRVLKPGGRLIVGFVDADSDLGRTYAAVKDDDPFYRHATFFRAEAVRSLFVAAGFGHIETRRTLFGPLDRLDAVQEPRQGDVDDPPGGFVAIRGEKPGP